MSPTGGPALCSRELLLACSGSFHNSDGKESQYHQFVRLFHSTVDKYYTREVRLSLLTTIDTHGTGWNHWHARDALSNSLAFDALEDSN